MSSTTTPTASSWQRGKVVGWIVSVDHKRIGAQYLGWAGVFFVLAALVTVWMRLQMTWADASVVGNAKYQDILTMHGTLLVFFVFVPLVVGLATYLVPLLIGAKRIAMPGLAALALWLYVFAGLAVVLSAFASGGPSKAGWTGYPPGTLLGGNGTRLWLIGLFILAISVTMSAANLAATIHRFRADGMGWPSTPMFVWSVYVWSAATLVLAPLAAIGFGLILLERRWPGSFDFFLTSDRTIKPWLIWLFGQSFAYAAVVPIFGMLAEIFGVFAGRAIASMKTFAQALVGIGGLTLILVLYHAYAGAIGKPNVVLLILAVIASIPSLVALVLLKTTLWNARKEVRWTAPMLFAVGAGVLFAIGIISAIAFVIFGESRDWRGTAFGGAHAHYLLWGTALLTLLGALTYWWPKVFGRLLEARSTAWAAILLFIGFNCTFLVQFLLGDQGQAAGASSFSAGGSTAAYNTISTIGAVITAAGALLFLYAVARSHNGRRAGNDPWRGDTLEWYTTSPPPAHNFDTLPAITSGRPLADLRTKLKDLNAL